MSVRADRLFPRLRLVMSENATTLQAAGAIHSDLEQGFIRAEVVAYEALIRCGSLAATRHEGSLRLEGKDYLVADGDIMTIRFNV